MDATPTYKPDTVPQPGVLSFTSLVLPTGQLVACRPFLCHEGEIPVRVTNFAVLPVDNNTP
jgi:hypothetical protein